MGTRKSTDAPALVLALARLGPAYGKWMSACLPRELSYARLQLLEALHGARPCKMSALSSTLAVTPRNVTALVDGLEAEGLAVRRPHPTDRRAVLVSLTPRGRRVVASAYARHQAAVSEVFSELSLTEQAQLRTLAERLLAELAKRGITASSACGPAVDVPRGQTPSRK